MKLLFSFSILTLFTIESIPASVQAMDYSQEDSGPIFSKKFKKNPSITKKRMEKILEQEKIPDQESLCIKRIAQGKELWIYVSQSLSEASQLGANPSFKLLHKWKKQNLPIPYTQWDYKLTVPQNRTENKPGSIEIYTFSLYLYPFNELMKLDEKEKKQFRTVISSQRKLASARPPLLSDSYIAQSKTIIDKMANTPGIITTENPLLQNVSTHFRILPNQTLKEALLKKFKSELSKLEEAGQRIGLKSLQKYLPQNLLEIIAGRKTDLLNLRHFKCRMQYWEHTNRNSANLMHSPVVNDKDKNDDEESE